MSAAGGLFGVLAAEIRQRRLGAFQPKELATVAWAFATARARAEAAGLLEAGGQLEAAGQSEAGGQLEAGGQSEAAAARSAAGRSAVGELSAVGGLFDSAVGGLFDSIADEATRTLPLSSCFPASFCVCVFASHTRLSPTCHSPLFHICSRRRQRFALAAFFLLPSAVSASTFLVRPPRHVPPCRRLGEGFWVSTRRTCRSLRGPLPPRESPRRAYSVRLPFRWEYENPPHVFFPPNAFPRVSRHSVFPHTCPPSTTRRSAHLDSEVVSDGRLCDFKQQELANLAWAFATAGIAAPCLFDALATEVISDRNIKKKNPKTVFLCLFPNVVPPTFAICPHVISKKQKHTFCRSLSPTDGFMRVCRAFVHASSCLRSPPTLSMT